METFVYGLLPRLENLGSSIYLIIFLVGILESLPLISILIPSSVILVAMGFFASEGTFHVTDLVWAASIGAVLGDSIGYYLGKYKNSKISQSNNVFFNSKYIEKTEIYFENHGGKTVFIGRFIGMLRPFVAFVAGRHHMKYSKFLFFNVTSGLLWSSIYIFLGYYFADHAKKVFMWMNISGYIFFGGIVVTIITVCLWKRFKKEKESLL